MSLFLGHNHEVTAAKKKGKGCFRSAATGAIILLIVLLAIIKGSQGNC